MLCHEDEVSYRDHGVLFIIRVLNRDRRCSRLSPASLNALSQLPDVAVTVRANIGPFGGRGASHDLARVLHFSISGLCLTGGINIFQENNAVTRVKGCPSCSQECSTLKAPEITFAMNSSPYGHGAVPAELVPFDLPNVASMGQGVMSNRTR
jgi:hypothetical protein